MRYLGKSTPSTPTYYLLYARSFDGASSGHGNAQTSFTIWDGILVVLPSIYLLFMPESMRSIWQQTGRICMRPTPYWVTAATCDPRGPKDQSLLKDVRRGLPLLRPTRICQCQVVPNQPGVVPSPLPMTRCQLPMQRQSKHSLGWLKDVVCHSPLITRLVRAR